MSLCWLATAGLAAYLILVEAGDGDAVGQLIREHLGLVVHDDRLGQIPPEDGQILEVSASDHGAGLSEQAVLDVLAGGVEYVEYAICVRLGAGGENNHFEFLRHALDKLLVVWPNPGVDLEKPSVKRSQVTVAPGKPKINTKF